MRKCILMSLLLLSGNWLWAQTNCLIFKDGAHIKACELYHLAIEYPQGSKESQELFIKSISACPTYAPSLNEMAVPYLKRGDFYTWRLLVDRAVKSAPLSYLGDRGSCLFLFLHDYPNALKDLKRLYVITKGLPGYSDNGDYDLRILMALCEREMGNYKQAIIYFNECIDKPMTKGNTGLYDYLLRGTTKLKHKDYKGALADFEKETKIYLKLADNYYYMGLAQKHLKQFAAAKLSFKHAKELYTKTGYFHYDPYCEPPDGVYLADINRELAN